MTREQVFGGEESTQLHKTRARDYVILRSSLLTLMRCGWTYEETVETQTQKTLGLFLVFRFILWPGRDIFSCA